VVKGANLPTYAETAALIDKLEYERTHHGSLLYERTADIAITSSGLFKFVKFKLFDGTQDNMAGFVVDKPDNFLELDLQKVQPAFRKVVVRGYQIEQAQIKLRIGGELVTPEVAETYTEEYAKIFVLKETVTPDALRMEFMGVRVELYEVEVF
jgi:hypothetical protein